MKIYQGPPLERARISKHEPAQYYVFLRLDGIWGPMVAQVFGPTVEEATRRARVVRLALEQKEPGGLTLAESDWLKALAEDPRAVKPKDE